jgi:hypothetical protein
MANSKGTKRKTAAGAKRGSAPAVNSALQESLDGLRDALDLTLTRVIEDDMEVEEARAVLRYLEKELNGFEKRTRPAKSQAHGARRRTTTARKSRRTRKR